MHKNIIMTIIIITIIIVATVIIPWVPGRAYSYSNIQV